MYKINWCYVYVEICVCDIQQFANEWDIVLIEHPGSGPGRRPTRTERHRGAGGSVSHSSFFRAISLRQLTKMWL